MKISKKIIVLIHYITLGLLLFIGMNTFTQTGEAAIPVPPGANNINIGESFTTIGTSNISKNYSNVVEITQNQKGQFGGLWFNQPINLSNDFAMEMYVYLGDKTQDEGGADGITFTFQNDPRKLNAIGSDGQGIGAYSRDNDSQAFIKNALSIEFDTYRNANPAGNQTYDLAVPEGSTNYGHVAYVIPGTNTQVLANGHKNLQWSNKEVLANNTWRKFELSWNATNKIVTYKFGNFAKQTININDLGGVQKIFGGNQVYWGFTGSTGNKFNYQAVSITKTPYDLGISKSANKESVKLGDTVGYTLKIPNNGSTTITNTVVTDVLPVGMDKPTDITIIGVTGIRYPLKEGKVNANESGAYYTWDNDSRTLKIYVADTVRDYTRVVVYNSKAIAGNDGDKKINVAKVVGDNVISPPQADATVTIIGEPKLLLTKKVDKSTVKIGDAVTYTVEGSNTGNAVLKDAVYTDILPQGLEKPSSVTYISNAGNRWGLKEGKENANTAGAYYTWDQNTQQLTVYASKIEMNQKSSIEYTTKVVNGNDGASLKNIVTLTGSNTTQKPSASATITVVGEPKLLLTKQTDKSTVKIGETLTYTVEGSNIGNAVLKDAVYTDILPKGLEKPSSVTYISNAGNRWGLREGKENANTAGAYYTWDQNTQQLTVYASKIEMNQKSSIEYTTKVLNGSDGASLKNIVTLTGSNTAQKPSADVTVTIVGEPDISVTKIANKATVEVGETVSYQIDALNSGNAETKDALFTDRLPAGMEKPTNVALLGNSGTRYPIEEGQENANATGGYYTWDESTHILTVHAGKIAISAKKSLVYDSKVLPGIDGTVLKNVVTLTASNTDQKPSADATVTLNKKTILHVKQEVLNKNKDIVVPSMGYISLSNVLLNNSSQQIGEYTMTMPSYEADTNKKFKSVKLNLNDPEYFGYLIKEKMPEFYMYEGYLISTVEQTHQSGNRKKSEVPVLDYSKQSEYWLTIYIKPTVEKEEPPYYNWDYKTNDFGTITVKK